VPSGESEGLANALDELLDRPQRRQELRLVQKLAELFPDLDWSERL